MSHIRVPYLAPLSNGAMLKDISAALDRLERNTLRIAPWAAFSYKPQTAFTIAYTESHILLKFYVHENSIRGLHALSNTPVHEDSCLEFFISFEDEQEYYNLEVNCIGTCLFGYGKEKDDRQMIDEETINKIRRLVLIEHSIESDDDMVYWELVVAIPVNAFIHHDISTLKDVQCRANVYKCGDQLPEPHFLVWNNIIATSPDFHLPQFFGKIHFV